MLCRLKVAAEVLDVLPQFRPLLPAEVRQRVVAVLEQKVQAQAGSVPEGVTRALQQAKAGRRFDIDAFLVLADLIEA